jgi:hypothetical protein
MTPELEDAIRRSGNNLHFKVVDFLEKIGWDVEISSYYVDDTTSKPREIDIIARKRNYLKGLPWNKHEDDFDVFLFIECKRFTNEVAFWTHKNKHPNDLVKHVNIEESLAHPNHHYFINTVSKLYTTSGKEGDIFDAITQPVKALVSFMDRQTLRGLYYPICIYDGIPELYLINKSEDLKNLGELQKTKNTLVELNYSWQKITNRPMPMAMQKYFAVDVVHFESLGDLIKNIDDEAEYIREKIVNKLNGMD